MGDMKTIAINISEDGQPLREKLTFETGVLLPGYILQVPAWQANRELQQKSVVEVPDGEAPQPREEVVLSEAQGFLE